MILSEEMLKKKRGLEDFNICCCKTERQRKCARGVWEAIVLVPKPA